MKRMLAVLAAGFLLLPVAGAAQVEIGMDGGVVFESYSDLETEFGTAEFDSETTLAFPTPWFRLGFGISEVLSVETVLSVNRLSEEDGSITALILLPGVNFAVGESGFYVRGEAGLQRVSYSPDQGDGESETQFSIGAAAGLKKPIAESPVSFRLEAGVGRWLENEDDFNPASTRIRLLAGISATVN